METKEQKEAYQIAINSLYGNPQQGQGLTMWTGFDYQKLYQEMMSEIIIEKRNQKINQILDDESTSI